MPFEAYPLTIVWFTYSTRHHTEMVPKHLLWWLRAPTVWPQAGQTSPLCSHIWRGISPHRRSCLHGSQTTYQGKHTSCQGSCLVGLASTPLVQSSCQRATPTFSWLTQVGRPPRRHQSNGGISNLGVVRASMEQPGDHCSSDRRHRHHPTTSSPGCCKPAGSSPPPGGRRVTGSCSVLGAVCRGEE